MRLDILGICGTFMGGVALIAREAGHEVSGADAGVYPPMSSLLREEGVDVREGYDSPPPARADTTVIGNALSRGNTAVERVLDEGTDYTSGAQWLAEHVLRDRWVLAVAGTHGKTTTASLLVWILEQAGYDPGFLIGGVPGNFSRSARLGGSAFFVIEADEYDTAFFDKRSKFVHFRPRTLVVNNLEFDHADIFPDLHAIETQFHHLIRTVPGIGGIIANGDEASVHRVLDRGCWSELIRFGTGAGNAWRLGGTEGDWRIGGPDGASFPFHSPLPGEHNARNCLAALLAARHVGVPLETGIEALTTFRGVRRRLELRGSVAGIRVIDDFAHHPTAIAATLEALRTSRPERILAVLEPRSNTMRLGVHRDRLAASLSGADAVYALEPPGLDWTLGDTLSGLQAPATIRGDVPSLAEAVVGDARPGDALLVMSNGGFGGIHDLLIDGLQARFAGVGAPP